MSNYHKYCSLITGYDQLSASITGFNYGCAKAMIFYETLWRMLKEKNITQYLLIQDRHVGTGQMDRLCKK